MKIAMLTFPVLDIGGITTWAKEFVDGAKKLGHEIDHYYAVSGKKYSCDENETVMIGGKYVRGEKIPSKVLSYHDDELESSINLLNEYDVVFFTHPSPHPTKGTVSNKCCLNWMLLYQNISGYVITVFHDRYWAKTNKWFVFVAEYIDLIVSAQAPFNPATLAFPTTAAKTVARFPMTVEANQPKKNRDNLAIIATQWIKWKGHHKLIKSLNEVDSVDIALYAGGQEYHNLHASGDLQEFLSENKVEGETYVDYRFGRERIYHGYIKHDDLVKQYRKALVSIDGSTRGYNNYTHFEPMMYGCISFVHEDVFKDPNCSIPPETCVQYNFGNLKEKIQWCLDNPEAVSKIRKAAFKFIQCFNNELVCANILKSVKEGKGVLSDQISPELLLKSHSYKECLIEAAMEFLPFEEAHMNEFVTSKLEDVEIPESLLPQYERLKRLESCQWDLDRLNLHEIQLMLYSCGQVIPAAIIAEALDKLYDVMENDLADTEKNMAIGMLSTLRAAIKALPNPDSFKNWMEWISETFDADGHTEQPVEQDESEIDPINPEAVNDIPAKEEFKEVVVRGMKHVDGGIHVTINENDKVIVEIPEERWNHIQLIKENGKFFLYIN